MCLLMMSKNRVVVLFRLGRSLGASLASLKSALLLSCFVFCVFVVLLCYDALCVEVGERDEWFQ